MEVNVISREQIKTLYDYAWKCMETSDIAISWQREHNAFQCLRQQDITKQWSKWSKHIQKGEIDALAINNVTKTYEGKTYYLMVVQPNINDPLIDPFGIVLLGFAVSGYIYAFFKEDQRDKFYKRFVELKE
jgi:hypothetical protein